MLPAVQLESENAESKTWDWSWSELCACAMETDYIQTSVAWTARNYAPVINCGAPPWWIRLLPSNWEDINEKCILHLQEMVEAAGEDERELAAEMAAAFLNENLPEAIFGAPKAGAGQWASLVRLINPIQGSTLDQVQLEQNEAAFRWAASDLDLWI